MRRTMADASVSWKRRSARARSDHDIKMCRCAIMTSKIRPPDARCLLEICPACCRRHAVNNVETHLRIGLPCLWHLSTAPQVPRPLYIGWDDAHAVPQLVGRAVCHEAPQRLIFQETFPRKANNHGPKQAKPGSWNETIRQTPWCPEEGRMPSRYTESAAACMRSHTDRKREINLEIQRGR